MNGFVCLWKIITAPGSSLSFDVCFPSFLRANWSDTLFCSNCRYLLISVNPNTSTWLVPYRRAVSCLVEILVDGCGLVSEALCGQDWTFQLVIKGWTMLKSPETFPLENGGDSWDLSAWKEVRFAPALFLTLLSVPCESVSVGKTSFAGLAMKPFLKPSPPSLPSPFPSSPLSAPPPWQESERT